MKKIYIVDGNSFVYRNFYAIPEMKTKDWQFVNCVFWMAKFLMWLSKRDKPDFLYMVRDAPWKTFRDELYSEYKANRDKTPDELKSQFPLVNDMIKKMWIPLIEVPWVEADDVIATLALELSQDKENMIYILSWDKDLFALVRENVIIKDTMKKKDFWIKETVEKFWIEPKFVTDYLSIVWDSSDNIPWIAGFWPKKAVELINSFWTLEEIYENVESLKWKAKEKAIDAREVAFLSKKLATLKADVKHNLTHKEHHFYDKDLLTEDAKNMLRELEFFSIIGEEEKKLETFEDTKLKVKTIKTEKELQSLEKEIEKEKTIFFDTETTNISPFIADLVGISIMFWDDNIFYINVKHEGENPWEKNLKIFLQNILNSDLEIVWHNIKYDLQIVEKFLSESQDSKVNIEKMQKSLF